MILRSQAEANRAAERAVGWLVVHKTTPSPLRTTESVAAKVADALVRGGVDSADLLDDFDEKTWKLAGQLAGLSEAPSPRVRAVVRELIERGVA